MPAYPRPHAAMQALFERVEEWCLRSYPVKDSPLRLRPAMVFFVAAWVILLGVLGLAPLPELPINDKALHFFGMGFATFVTYFVLEVPEGPHRRVWYIRRAPLLFTLVTTFFAGGILSEIVQSLLPYKTFQMGDIVANLCGSTLFLYAAHVLAQHRRRRNEIAELYTPLSAHAGASYRDAQGRTHAFAPAVPGDRDGGGVELGGAGVGAAAGLGAAAAGAALVDADEDAGPQPFVLGGDVWDDELDDDMLGHEAMRGSDMV